ncbi:MAG: tetratricopeptide repeat protein [Desulfobulbaceae bacterium]|nr:MAG: tetratricopeptide repeat protein [Desulfobulbaceae bacterium]
MKTPSRHRRDRNKLSRRTFLALMSASALGFTLGGCAVNPVTGQRQLMLLSEDQEVAIDREHAPHQFSADFGVSRDLALNGYVSSTGRELAAFSHRPQMPYSFQVVNANHINAYAFPGGTIAVTRGIMLEMNDEAELAALLGHEIGHVTARHAAQRMTRGLIAQLAVVGATLGVTATEDRQGLAPLVQTLGGISAGVLLAHHSRDDEREADALGMKYADRAGQNPAGMTDLHQILVDQSRRNPNALELMFATHPMSGERLATAQGKMANLYRSRQHLPHNVERYQDQTATLRLLKPSVEEQRLGEKAMARERFARAEPHLKRALTLTPGDYTALILMSRCQFGLGRKQEAAEFADQARLVFPGEPQALHVAGIARLGTGDHEVAYQHFMEYEKLLPGNPNTTFLKGVARENMGQRATAARYYLHYLRQVNRGGQTGYVRQRLTEWGVLRPR